jgi:hypothetical protein
MMRYRLKVTLLTLGVVLGYGSAFAHFAWHHHHPGWHHACGTDPWSFMEPGEKKSR